MTDKKKPPSMRVAAATQKLSKAELEDLLKAAENATDDADPDEPAPADAEKKKPAAKKKR